MNISIIASKLNFEGAGSNVSLHCLAKRLSELGHSVEVRTVNIERANTIKQEVPYSVKSLSDGESTPKALQNILTSLRETEDSVDVYHIFSPIFIPVGGFYRARGGETPVVGRLNSYTLFCTNPNMMDGKCHASCSIVDKFAHAPGTLTEKVSDSPRYIYNELTSPRFSNYIDGFFALSPQVRQIYIDHGIEKDKIKVIPNFYDSDFTESKSTSVEPSDLLYVGRLEESKGVGLLLESLQGINRDLEVSIIGDGADKESLMDRSDSLPDCVDVSFHGWVDYTELSEYYRQAQWFVHPGRWPEPFGRTVLEAMQCGTPAIVSEIGAPPWIIDEAGLTFEPGDHNDLTETIDFAINNPELQQKLSEQTNERIREFEPSKIIHEVVNSYKALL